MNFMLLQILQLRAHSEKSEGQFIINLFQNVNMFVDKFS